MPENKKSGDGEQFPQLFPAQHPFHERTGVSDFRNEESEQGKDDACQCHRRHSFVQDQHGGDDCDHGNQINVNADADRPQNFQGPVPCGETERGGAEPEIGKVEQIDRFQHLPERRVEIHEKE